MRDEFDPVASFEHLIKNWWKIVLVAVIGGLLGFAFSMLKPPLYESEVIFHTSIDFTQINYENLVGHYGEPVVWSQFEEDLALQVFQRVFKHQLGETFFYSQTLDPAMEYETFRKDWQLERYLGQWIIRFRHTDPEIARDVVSFWAEKGYTALLAAQEAGRLESFVIVDQVTEASTPQEPTYYKTGILVLAGTVAGLLVGILGVNFSQRYRKPTKKEA